jgi:N6-L-threonylcarbamoyladenine synthase
LEGRTRADIADIAASFQQAVVDTLVGKTLRAVEQTGVATVVMGGGVAANGTLRSALADACKSGGIAFHAAKREYCTDNAAMIAALGYHHFAAGDFADLDLDAQATGRA